MWLPKEERQLLHFYYNEVKKSNSTPMHERWYSEEDLPSVVGYSESELPEGKEQSDNQAEQVDLDGLKKDIKECTHAMAKVASANAALAGRNLIEVKPHQHQTKVGISLTIDGYELGRKYSSCFTRLGLWWEEHKVNPIWYILGLLVSYAIGKLA